jgi:hypothetical protein
MGPQYTEHCVAFTIKEQAQRLDEYAGHLSLMRQAQQARAQHSRPTLWVHPGSLLLAWTGVVARLRVHRA